MARVSRPIPVRVLHEVIANRIREMIRKGELTVGERIVEKRFCEMFGVSRTPLREALRSLSSEGLVELIPHRGAFVSRPSMAEVRDLFQVMAVLEGTAARLAAERMTPAEFDRLNRYHARLERCFERRDPEAYIRANHAYHTFVQKLSRNRTLDEVLTGLRHRVFLYRYQQLYRPRRFQESIREHRLLMDAFRRGDPADAERRMREHLLNQCEALVSLYEHPGEAPGDADSTRPAREERRKP